MNRRGVLSFFSLGAAASAAPSIVNAAAPNSVGLADTGMQVGIKSGDMVVITHPYKLSNKAVDGLRQKVRDKFREDMGIDVGVMVLQEDLKLSVISGRAA